MARNILILFSTLFILTGCVALPVPLPAKVSKESTDLIGQCVETKKDFVIIYYYAYKSPCSSAFCAAFEVGQDYVVYRDKGPEKGYASLKRDPRLRAELIAGTETLPKGTRLRIDSYSASNDLANGYWTHVTAHVLNFTPQYQVPIEYDEILLTGLSTSVGARDIDMNKVKPCGK